jgi:hypothetical protein
MNGTKCKRYFGRPTTKFLLDRLGLGVCNDLRNKTHDRRPFIACGKKRGAKCMKVDQRMYQIACSFPALVFKGVERGDISGISPDGFCDGKLYDFLSRGRGGAWSAGEVLIIEFLLNLYDPYEYKAFNFGRALNVLDQRNMEACMKAAIRVYYAG